MKQETRRPSPPVAPAVLTHTCTSADGSTDPLIRHHCVACAAGQARPVAPEPAQEAGGVERVTHEEARRYAHALWELPLRAAHGKRLELYIDQQEQSEREAASLRTQLAQRLDGLRELQQLYAAFEGSGHSPKNPREAAQAIEQMADDQRDWAALESERDAERTQKEAALALAAEWEKLRNLCYRDLRACQDKRDALRAELAKRCPSCLGIDRCYSDCTFPAARQPTEAAPVAKVEAPSEPAGWVPQPKDRVRNYLAPTDLGTIQEIDPVFQQFGLPVIWDKSPGHLFYVSIAQLVRVVEPAPQPPATSAPLGGLTGTAYEQAMVQRWGNDPSVCQRCWHSKRSHETDDGDCCVECDCIEFTEPGDCTCSGATYVDGVAHHDAGCRIAPQPPATIGGDRLTVAEAQLEMIRVVVLGSRPGCRPFDDAAKMLEKAR